MNVYAYVNHGRWVADCPLGCGCAAIVQPGQPFDCRSRGGGFCCDALGSPVVCPPDALAIEHVLAGRPTPNRNWYVGETVDALRAENVAHQIGGA